MPMQRDEIMAKVTTVFRSVFDDDELVLTEKTSAPDIDEWDSLNQIRLILGMQSAFGVNLPPEKVNELKNVGEVLDFIAARLP